MRHKYLRVSVFMFLELLKHGTEGIRVVSNPLPEDTKFVRAGYDSFGNLFLTLESKEWPEVAEFDELLELPQTLFEKK